MTNSSKSVITLGLQMAVPPRASEYSMEQRNATTTT